MDRSILLKRLDIAANQAVSLAITRSSPIKISKKSTLIGNMLVEKNKDGLYDVCRADKTLLYKDISVFDVAVIIAQRYNSGERAVVKKILVQESIFAKHHNDMLHYLNCLKIARKNHNIERMAILEDKFQLSEVLAKHARNSISIFKRVK